MIKIRYLLIILFFFFLKSGLSQAICLKGKIEIITKNLIYKICIPSLDKCEPVIENSYSISIKDTGTYYYELLSDKGIEYANYFKIHDFSDTIENNITDKQYVLSEVTVGGLKENTGVNYPQITFKSSKLSSNGNRNLCEGINTITGINARTTCGVCNSTEIQINNLPGIYSAICIDGIPNVSSLGSSYGLSGLPLELIKEVNITKGPFNTKISNEGIAGTIEIKTKDYVDLSKLTFSMQTSSLGENDLSIGFKQQIKSKKHIFYFNTSGTIFSNDKNRDSFTDFSNYKNLNLFYSLWLNDSERKTIKLTSRVFIEDRWGGEISWTKNDRGKETKYGESIISKRTENNLLVKYKKETSSINYIISHTFHEQDAFYGTNKYLANQQILFSQFEYIKNTNKLLLENGINFRGTRGNENTNLVINEENNELLSNYNIGYFIQSEWRATNNLSLINSGRIDYNALTGWLPSFRSGITGKMNQKLQFNLFCGNGYRQLQFISEEHALLNGSRKVKKEINKPVEESWSINASFNYKRKNQQITFEFEGGIFYTYFKNKIIIDYESQADKIILKNTNGNYYNRGFYTNINTKIKNKWEIDLGMNNADIISTEIINNNVIRVPIYFNPKFSFNYSITYQFIKSETKISISGNTKSPMDLPLAEKDFRRAQSPWFCIINVFLTKKIKDKFNVQIGVRNVLNFVPDYPILRAEDPFYKTQLPSNRDYSFDAAYNYSAVKGAHLVVNIKYTLN